MNHTEVLHITQHNIIKGIQFISWNNKPFAHIMGAYVPLPSALANKVSNYKYKCYYPLYKKKLHNSIKKLYCPTKVKNTKLWCNTNITMYNSKGRLHKHGSI